MSTKPWFCGSDSLLTVVFEVGFMLVYREFEPIPFGDPQQPRVQRPRQWDRRYPGGRTPAPEVIVLIVAVPQQGR